MVTQKNQFIGYLLSGVCATIAHFLILWLLASMALVDPVFATSLGYLCGAITGFSLNQRYVFKSQTQLSSAFIRYLLMAAFGGILNAGLMFLIHHILQWHYLIAQLIATPTVVIANFYCCRLWVFKEPSHVR